MCEHEPVEQVRQAMSSGDYFDTIHNGMDEVKWVRELPSALHSQLHQHLVDKSDYEVEITKDNATDVRIICRKCHMTTGWMKADAPGMPPGIGLSVIRSRWDEIKNLTPEELNDQFKSKGGKTRIITVASLGE